MTQEQASSWSPCSSSRRKFLFAFLVADILIFCVYYGSNKNVFTSTIFVHETFEHRNISYNVIQATFRNSTRNGVPTNATFYKTVPPGVDIHEEHPVFGHTWSDGEHVVPVVNPKDIAIGLGITTRSRRPRPNVASYPFFKSFMPSFCRTCSDGYNYNFYLAHDDNDPKLLDIKFADAWAKLFVDFTTKNCPQKSNYSIHYIKCSHSKKPAWAQNDAMIEAYFNNMAYYYRINDDTILKGKGWTEGFINQLGKYIPRNVGVVGPKHSGGNTAILTYDFVHISHVDVFGFYYPRAFPQWYGDRWITDVYKPGRTTKMPEFPIAHTMEDGQRYSNKRIAPARVKETIDNGKAVLLRYLDALKENHPKPSGTKIISMGLWGIKPEYTFGAVRNAQLVPVYFPRWKLRVYVSDRKPELIVPAKVISKLKLLGAEVVYVNASADAVPPKRWRYLVTLDSHVTHFLIRDADSRISARDSALVEDWLKVPDKPFHCIRDHKRHVDQAVVDGLWGGITKDLSKLLPVSWDKLIHSPQEAMSSLKSDKPVEINNKNILNLLLWPKLESSSYCHDSVSCDKWPNAVKFPVKRTETVFLGQSFQPFGDPYDADIASAKAIADDKCVQIS